MLVTGAPVTAETKLPKPTLFQPGGLSSTHLSLKGVNEILQSDYPEPVIVVVHSGGPKGTTHTAQVVLLSPHNNTTHMLHLCTFLDKQFSSRHISCKALYI